MSDYDIDLPVWSERQAALLRRLAHGQLPNEAPDWPNLAEEIESLGKSQGRELASRVNVIILHLMKLQASPAIEPQPGWRATVLEQRDEIERLLADAPSLRGRLPAVIAEETERARRRARAAMADYGEHPRRDLETLSYSTEEVLGMWLPEA